MTCKLHFADLHIDSSDTNLLWLEIIFSNVINFNILQFFSKYIQPAGDVLWVFVEPGNLIP